MSLSSPKDKLYAKKEADAARNKKKNSSPERITDHLTDQLRTQGNGSRYRVIPGWYSDEMGERFNKIFKRIHDEKEENADKKADDKKTR